MRYILLLVLSLFSFISESYGQGIKATFSPSSRFFPGYGNVTIGKFKDQTITIKNDSSSTGTLVCAVSGPSRTDYSVIGPTSFGVNVGQTYSLTIRFQPTSAGPFRDTIYVAHNADTSITLTNPVRYILNGTGVVPDTFPKITVTTGSFGTFLNIGNVTVGKTKTATFTIKNTSDTIRTLTGNVSLPATSRFSIISGGGAFSLDTGKLHSVTLSFAPDTVANFLQDSIIITSNANSPNNRIKVTVFGNGIKNDTFPQIALSGIQMGNLNFRNDTLPNTKTLTFTMRNTSDSLRTLTGSVQSPGSPFAITSGAGAFSLDSGMTKLVTVTFTPTKAGVFADTIIITTNSDAPNQLIKIPLTGVGVVISGPRISVSPPTLNFGTLNLNAPIIPLTATIKNLSDSVKDTLTGTVAMPNLPFTITSGSGNFNLAHNDSLHIIVQMATDKSGTFKDSIIITSNSNDNSKRFVIRLSGFVAIVGVVKSGDPQYVNFITSMPNPFNGKVAIGFSLNEISPVSLNIYDMTGKEVFFVGEHLYQAGVQQIEWNANAMASGAYLCLLHIGKETRSIRVIKE